jgi:tetratricopeptide (TPR) repeat protein
VLGSWLLAGLALGAPAKSPSELQTEIAVYTQAIARNPHDVAAHISRGTVRAKLGDTAGAIADDTAALAVEPRNVAALTNRANARAAQRDFRGAMADYNRALALDPRHAAAFLNRGNVETEQQNYEAAIVDYDHALALNPANMMAVYDRAAAERATDNDAVALDDYSKVIAAQPDDVRALLNRAVLRMAQRDWAAAQSDLTRCLDLTTGDRQIYPRLYLWVIGVQQGDGVRATQDLQRFARQGSPAYAGTWPMKLESFCAGEMAEPKLLLAAMALQPAKGPDPFAQACYFAGIQRTANHDMTTATRLFQKSVADGNPKLHEVILSREELKR